MASNGKYGHIDTAHTVTSRRRNPFYTTCPSPTCGVQKPPRWGKPKPRVPGRVSNWKDPRGKVIAICGTCGRQYPPLTKNHQKL